jgi:hypothetical protein
MGKDSNVLSSPQEFVGQILDELIPHLRLK